MSTDIFKMIGKVVLAAAMVTGLGAVSMTVDARGPVSGAFVGPSMGKGVITTVSEGDGGDRQQSSRRDPRGGSTKDRNGADR